MNIGEVSELSLMNSKMIRRYEDLGILSKAKRTKSGYRKYTMEDVHILRFVKRAKELGFSMKSIKDLLGLWKNKNRASSQVKELAQSHVNHLEKKLNEIQSMVSTLKKLMKECHGDHRSDCPILDELEHTHTKPKENTMEAVAQWKYDSKIGPLYLVAGTTGLQGVFWKKQSAPMIKTLKENPILMNTTEQLEEYLDGKRKKFELPLEMIGTDFQKKVWKELTKVPFGKTLSYKDIATKLHNDKATRAVGTANGKNPLCIIVPCHRIIASDGTLGGYSGGLGIKTKLLALEQGLSK